MQATAPGCGAAAARAGGAGLLGGGIVGAAIALSKDDPDTVADLPAVVRTATWAAHTDPTTARVLASLMGTLRRHAPAARWQSQPVV